jgi:hypothetical protein
VRVIKVYRQTNTEHVSYPEAVRGRAMGSVAFLPFSVLYPISGRGLRWACDDGAPLLQIKRVIKEDGVAGLFGRGLGTKIFSNGMQVGHPNPMFGRY